MATSKDVYAFSRRCMEAGNVAHDRATPWCDGGRCSSDAPSCHFPESRSKWSETECFQSAPTVTVFAPCVDAFACGSIVYSIRIRFELQGPLGASQFESNWMIRFRTVCLQSSCCLRFILFRLSWFANHDRRLAMLSSFGDSNITDVDANVTVVVVLVRYHHPRHWHWRRF